MDSLSALNSMAYHYFLENEDWATVGIDGRCFFQFPYDFEQSSTEKHVATIDELLDVQAQEHPDTWVLSFKYREHCFAIDSHYHSTTSSFIVSDPTCPDEILIQILGLFANPMKIASNDWEPTHTELKTEPPSLFQRVLRRIGFGG